LNGGRYMRKPVEMPKPLTTHLGLLQNLITEPLPIERSLEIGY